MTTERIALTREYAEACFIYNKDTGAVWWKHRPIEHFKNQHAYNVWNTRFAGMEIKRVNDGGYSCVSVLGRPYRLHRIIWLLETGSFPQAELDHINHNRSDNRLENLRETSRVENSKNQSARINNTSGISGVSWYKKGNKWRAQIWVNGKAKHLGLFDTKEEAALAVAEAYKANGYHENHGK